MELLMIANISIISLVDLPQSQVSLDLQIDFDLAMEQHLHTS